MKEIILIYQTETGDIKTEVTLQNESVWLTQIQIGEVFGVKRPAVTKHLTQIFKDQELTEDSVCSILERTAADKKRYKTKFYNLDAIIAVGYRVNSKKATQFRIWANHVLKDYLIKGYAINDQRLKQQTKHLKDLEKTLRLFQEAQSKSLSHSEASGLLNVLTDYTHSFILLNQYDTGNFPEGGLNSNITVEIDLDHAMNAINELKQRLIAQNEATELFGHRKDDSFVGILGNIVQSFGGEYLYPSIDAEPTCRMTRCIVFSPSR